MAYATTTAEIETATANAEQTIHSSAQDLNLGLAKIAPQAAADQQSQLAQYTTGLQQQASTAQTMFATQTNAYGQSVAQRVTMVNHTWQAQSQQLMVNYQNVEGNLTTQLNIAQSQIDQQRHKLVTDMAKEIDIKSAEAAAKVQPGWKKVLKIVVNILITVAVSVAIAALALSGVGIVALIGLAALIGAAGGIAKLAANDLIDGKTSSFKDYLKAGGVGAATGVLEAVGAKAVVGLGGKLGAQVLTKVEHMVLSTGIESVTNTLVEVTESLAQGEDFTLKLLAVSVGSSLLSTAGGKYIDVKFSDIGRGAARGATSGAGDAAASSVGRVATEGVQSGARQGLGREVGQFATETAFDTAVNTGASVAKGEELTWESFGENLAGGVLGRGAAGRADKLYGNRLRNLGSNNRVDRPTPNTANRDRGDTPTTEGINTKSQNQNNLGDRIPNNRTNSELASKQPRLTDLERNPEFEQVASEGLSVPVSVYSDPDLAGNTVRAEYELDSNGVVQNVYLRAGADATATDIKLHQHTVKVMRMYGGTLGRVRLVEAKIAKWMGVHGQPKTGSKAWEAQHEVPKLEKVIEERMARLETAEPNEARRLEAEVKNLQDQLKQHRRTFERGDESDGVGYVAQRGVKRKAEEITSLRQKAPVELKTQLEQPPVGVLTKQDIGEWLWKSENPSKDPSTMPTNLTARADVLIKQWKEQGLEVYSVDGKIIFDKSIYEQYQVKKLKQSEGKEKYVSPYLDSMYSDAEKITVADGWEFQTGEIISTADRVAGQKLDAAIETRNNQQTNDPNQIIEVDPTVFGDAAAALNDFSTEQKFKVGETEGGQDIGYRHFGVQDQFGNTVGRIGGLESGNGLRYPEFAKRLEGADVGERLDRLRRGEKLPDDEYSPIIGELYGLWFAKEGSHSWQRDNPESPYEATYEHKRDLIYSEMLVDLMKSGNITFIEALDLHPASYNGAQTGAQNVTREMRKKRMSQDGTDARKQRDKRYRREKATIQKWFEVYGEQLKDMGLKPTLENLEKFILQSKN